MRMYMSGIQPPKLGSRRDRVMQAAMVKESEREVKKNSLLAFMAMNTVSARNTGDAQKQFDKITKAWSNYLELEFGMKIPEHTEKEVKMVEFYQRFVKNAKLKVKYDKKKNHVVLQGLETLFKYKPDQ